MKKYLHPEMETLEIAQDDIVMTSGGELGDGGTIGEGEMGDNNT